MTCHECEKLLITLRFRQILIGDIFLARPVASSISTIVAHKVASPCAGSILANLRFSKNIRSGTVFSMPITEWRCRVNQQKLHQHLFLKPEFQ